MEDADLNDLSIIYIFFVIGLHKNLCWGRTQQAIESGMTT